MQILFNHSAVIPSEMPVRLAPRDLAVEARMTGREQRDLSPNVRSLTLVRDDREENVG
jgi:hypothetical protein